MTLFAIPKRLNLYRNVHLTVEIYCQKRLGTVQTCFYMGDMF